MDVLTSSTYLGENIRIAFLLMFIVREIEA